MELAKLTDRELRLYYTLIQREEPQLLEEFARQISSRNHHPPKLIIPAGLVALRVVLFSLPLMLALPAYASVISNWGEPTSWGKISTDIYRGQIFNVQTKSTLDEIGFYLGDAKTPAVELGLYSLESQNFLSSVVFSVPTHFEMRPYAVDFDTLLEAGDYAFFLKGDIRTGYLDSSTMGSALYYPKKFPHLEVRPQDFVFYVMLEPSHLSEPNSCRLFMLNAGWLLVVMGARGRALCVA